MIGFIFLLISCHGICEEQKSECIRTMESFAAVGKQLKNNPNLTIDELNTMTGWLTSNLKLREFLKVHLIPRLLDKNPDVIEKFIRSKEAIIQCEEAKNF
jgi:uncharacterized protein YneF (UPF0154 family)